jgi:energy-coupling factor transporter ATP-binding protein EcfA2
MSPDPKKTWKQLYNLFNPAERLEYNQQDLYVSRPRSVAQKIAELLRHNVEPTGKWIVCGSMGCGKSTELVHLAKVLENDYSVVALDLVRSLRADILINQVQPSEVLFAIGAGAVQMAREDLGYEVPKALVDDLTKAFGGLLHERKGVDLSKLLQGVARFAANVALTGGSPVGAAIGAADASAGALGGLTRSVKEGSAELEKLRIAVNAVLDHLSAKRHLAVLVDGLDKVDDEGRIRDLFVMSRILMMPRTQIVYAAPIDLMLGPLWNTASSVFRGERLTNVVVNKPQLAGVEMPEEKLSRGRETMTAMVTARLDRVGLSLDGVFDQGSLDPLITASGGLIRDLVRLVRSAVLSALMAERSRIDLSTAEHVITELRKEFEITLDTRTVDELRHVSAHGEPSSSEKHVRDLFLGGYVLPYSNGRVWFEPHPILRGVRDGI